MSDWEYRAVHLPVGVTARHAREVLGLHAEFGGWELHHHAVWTDGRRKITLRRRLARELSHPQHVLAP